jgi:hypothetical protein
MQYDYLVLTGKHKNSVIQIEHSIKDEPFTSYQIDGRLCKVKRLISGGTNFILKGGMWSRDGYSAGVQSMPSKEDRANFDKPNKK